MLAVLVVFLLPTLTLPADSSTLWVVQLVFIALVTGLAVFFEGWRFVRRVVVDPKSVRFDYPFRRYIVDWSRLGPTSGPPQLGSFGFLVRGLTSGTWTRSHIVTIRQARAILEYPSGRTWEITAEIANKLGVRPTDFS